MCLADLIHLRSKAKNNTEGTILVKCKIKPYTRLMGKNVKYRKENGCGGELPLEGYIMA